MFLNRKWLLFIAMIMLGISFTVFVIQSEITFSETPFDDRNDLKEVVFSNTSCAETWRTDTSKPDIVNQAVLDAWCEKAWYDMITQKEGRQTDARLIGNIMRGAC